LQHEQRTIVKLLVAAKGLSATALYTSHALLSSTVSEFSWTNSRQSVSSDVVLAREKLLHDIVE